MAAEEDQQESAKKIAGVLPVWVVNVWIGGILGWFFVIRILGSRTARYLLSMIGLHHGE